MSDQRQASLPLRPLRPSLDSVARGNLFGVGFSSGSNCGTMLAYIPISSSGSSPRGPNLSRMLVMIADVARNQELRLALLLGSAPCVETRLHANA